MKYAVKAHFANWGQLTQYFSNAFLWLNGCCKSAHYFCH